MAKLDLEKYRKDAQRFLSSMDTEYYLHFSGRKKVLDLAPIYAQSRLFSKKTIRYFQDKADQENGDKKKYGYLLKFCTEHYLEEKARPLKEAIANEEAKMKVGLEGRTVPFRYLEVLLSNEPDKKKRDRIEDLRNEKIGSMNANLEKYWTKLHQQAKHLGFESYRSLFAALKQEDLVQTAGQMKTLTQQTQDVYEKHFGQLLKKKLGLDLGRSRRSDFAYLKRGKEYDPYFKKERLVPAFCQTLRQLGIDIDDQKNIIFDVEPRENKTPRAFCCTVQIPQEIYLVIMPSGGQDDYEALFHEGGHAQHYGHTLENLDFEYKFLGDHAVTEGYAFLMESLLQDKSWLTGYLGMDTYAAAQFINFSTLLKLWYCRRYAAKLQYELILHHGQSMEGMHKHYARILSQANLMDYDPRSYLNDVDEGFYCTNYIRAWMFSAQLKHDLLTRFGHNWHTNKKAGAFLKDLWQWGQKYDAAEILSQLGFTLDVDFLIDSMRQNILSLK